MLIFLSSHPTEGRFHETSRKRGGARRPRARLVTSRSGGLGNRSGGTKTAPQGACWTGTVPPVSGPAKARQADEANWRRGLRRKPGRKPGNADPGIRNRRTWSAERRPRSREGARHDRIPAAPRGAPPPRHGAGGRPPDPRVRGAKEARRKPGGTTAYPAPQRIRAAERWLAAPKRCEGGLFENSIGGKRGNKYAVVPAEPLRGPGPITPVVMLRTDRGYGSPPTRGRQKSDNR